MTHPAQNPRPPMPAFHPSRMVLLVERVTTRPREPEGQAGAVLISSPHLPGWQVCVRGAVGLARAFDEAWTEHAVRAYANSHGEQYDVTDREEHVGPPVLTDSGEWHEQPDGSWRSPTGHIYRASSKMVAQIVALRDQGQATG